MTDPTPVTATDEERQAFQRYRGLTLSQEDYDEIRAAERARIFAALPAAIHTVEPSIAPDGVSHMPMCDTRAAALAAAIEAQLSRESGEEGWCHNKDCPLLKKGVLGHPVSAHQAWGMPTYIEGERLDRPGNRANLESSREPGEEG